MTPRELVELARRVVWSHPRRPTWAEPRELEQAALEGMLAARQTWDPGRGALEPHLAVAGRWAITRHFWEFVGPVKRRNDRHLGPAVATEIDEPGLALAARGPSPEEEAWRSQLRARLARALEPHPHGAKVLLGLGRPREVAEEHGVAVEDVYRCTHRARRAVRRELADYEEETP